MANKNDHRREIKKILMHFGVFDPELLRVLVNYLDAQLWDVMLEAHYEIKKVKK